MLSSTAPVRESAVTVSICGISSLSIRSESSTAKASMGSVTAR